MQTLGVSFLLLLCGLEARSATYYVDPVAGSCAGNYSKLNRRCDGSDGYSYPLISSGLQVLKPGDTLYIRGGTYSEVLSFGSGVSGSLITVSGYPLETVVLAPRTSLGQSPLTPGNYTIVKDLIIDGVNGPSSDANNIAGIYISGRNTVTLQNIEIKNWWYNGLFLEYSSNITVRGCKIHHQRSVSGKDGTRWQGFYVHEGNNFLFENNDVYNNPGGGGQFYPGPINGVIFRNNRIHNNNTITTGNSNVGGVEIMQSGYAITNVQVYNNLFYNNNTPGAGISPGFQIHGASGVKVWNNTAYGNKDFGFIFWGDAANTEFRNNISYGNGGGTVLNQSSSTIQSNNLFSNPFFANADAGDFHLTSASTDAIDKGINVGLPFSGAAPDIGAYEFVSNPLTKPATPTNLKVQ
jgi:hypothetical protein